MGRIKTKLIKRVSQQLYREHAKDFKKDFAENKQLVEKYVVVHSRKLRNVIAGYITRLVKAREI